MKANFKRSLARVANSGAASLLLSGCELAARGRGERLSVVTYHRVDVFERRPDLDPAMISATPRDFEQQMQFLARRYNVLSLNTLLESRRTGRPLPPRAVLVTFDDAYQDFAEFAWPVLRALRLPVTVFVPTAFPDHPAERFWWDRLHSRLLAATGQAVQLPWGPVEIRDQSDRRKLLKQMKTFIKEQPHDLAMKFVQDFCQGDEPSPNGNGVLSWSELKRLHAEGVTLAAHTRTHPLLNQIPTEQAVQETLGSIADLREQLGEPVPPAIAYPAGGISPEVIDALRAAGVELGFTTRRGVNIPKSGNCLELKRINVGQTTNLGLLRAQLLALPGWFHSLQ